MDLKTKIIIGILIIGSVVIGGLGILEKKAHPKPPERTFPQGLIVANQNGLVNLAYNPSSQTYEKQAEIILSRITGIVGYDDYIFISTEDEILRFNSKFEKSVSKKFEGISTLATDNINIFISAGGYFITLDKDLKELNRVGLEFNGRNKNAHHILVYKGTAYLLDNVILPVFIIRVDIKNPKNVQIKDKILIEDIWPHLDEQWLNPDLNQWMVIQSYQHEGGSGQKIHIYPMDKGTEKLASQEIIHNSYYSGPQECYGIRGITHFPPIWAIMRDAPGKYYLAQISSEDNKISFSNSLDLGNVPDETGKIVVKNKDNYLFIVATFKRDRIEYDPEHDWRSQYSWYAINLKIIDIGHKPQIIFSKDLGEFDNQRIIDILPY